MTPCIFGYTIESGNKIARKKYKGVAVMTGRLKKVVVILLALFITATSVCILTNVNKKAYADAEVSQNTGEEVGTESLAEGSGAHTALPDPTGDSTYYAYRNAFPADAQFSAYPMITVLTHGMGSDATVWSNDISKETPHESHFAYDEFSLIERLRCKSNAIGNQVVRAVIRSTPNTPASGNTYSFTLKKVDLIQGANGKAYSGNASALSLSQLDPTKHLIVIYDAECMASASNKEDFYAFAKMLLNIVYTLKDKSDGIYPKINLIGHSRGGLTNLAFAMAYPELVSSLTSIGTPYFGSNFGKIKFLVDTIMGKGNYVKKYNEKDAFVSIQDEFVQNDMVTRWNNNYDTKYSGIKLKILGGYSRINFIKQALRTYGEYLQDIDMTGEEIADQITTLQRGIFLLGVTNVSGSVASAINDMVNATFAEDDENREYYTVTTNEVKEVLLEAIRHNENGNDEGSLFLYDDLMVSLNSQIGRIYEGVSYRGFAENTYCKSFETDINNIQAYKFAQANMPIVHNLETRDPFFVNEIVYGNSTTETHEAIELGSYERVTDGENAVLMPVNKKQVVADGRDIRSDVVIVRSDKGASVLTDDGYMNNDYDEIELNWFFNQCCMDLNFNSLPSIYNKIAITLSGDVKEGDDGYQWVSIFSTSATSGTQHLGQVRTEHGSGVKDTTWSYTLIADFDLFLNNFSDGVIVIRYSASGKQNDDWYCRNIKMTVRIYNGNN